MLTDLFAPFLLTALLIELTPGPNMAWLALTSASHGRRSGIAAVLGIAAGLSLLALASAVGMTQLETRAPAAMTLLRYAGVAYLLWLAWKAWTGEEEMEGGKGDPSSALAWFRHGFLLNLLNPKAAMFFITVLPAYIASNHPAGPQYALLSVSYVAVATLIHLAIVLLAGRAHDWISVGKRSHVVRRVFAVSLAFIALWFFFNSG